MGAHENIVEQTQTENGKVCLSGIHLENGTYLLQPQRDQLHHPDSRRTAPPPPSLASRDETTCGRGAVVVCLFVKFLAMNALTQIKNTQALNWRELEQGIGERASWHAEFRDSAYVYVGGLPKALTEGDVLAVMGQCGEIVHLDMPRGKEPPHAPRGFAFLAYEDQRSTVLAVDNLNGATVAGRTIRVEHVKDYRAARATEAGEGAPPAAAAPTAASARAVDEDAPGAGGADDTARCGAEPSGGSVFDLLRSTVSLDPEGATPAAKDEKGERKRRHHHHRRRRHDPEGAALSDAVDDQGERKRRHHHHHHRHHHHKRHDKE